MFAAQASGLDLLKAGFACMPEIQQNFFDACKVGADEIFVIFNVRQWVHDLFAELEVLRSHIEGALALQRFGAHAPAGSQFDLVQGGGHAGRSLMSRSCIHAYFGAEVEWFLTGPGGCDLIQKRLMDYRSFPTIPS